PQHDLADAQAQLLQSQKLLAIGQLAAGIAHEINTPTQYVSDNASFLQGAFGKLLAVVEAVRPVIAGDAADPAALAAARKALAASRLDYLIKQVPRALEQTLEGLDRIKTIVM